MPDPSIIAIASGIEPSEGRKAIPMDIAIPSSGIVVDLVPQNLRQQFKNPQTLYVDNADNDFQIVITNNITAQRFVIAAKSQGYYQLIIPSPARIKFECANAPATIKVQILNFYVEPVTWLVEKNSVITPGQIVLPDGDILIGQPDGFAAAKTPVGDLTLSDTGNVTVLSASDISGFSVPNGPIIPNQTEGIKGTTTNNDADTGSVGEVIRSTVSAPGAIPATSLSFTNITSILLTPGDWDIYGVVAGIGTATSLNRFIAAIYPIINDWAEGTLGAYESTATNNLSLGGICAICGPLRASLSVSTRYYLNTYEVFSGGTMNVFGEIYARRMR